MKKHDQLFVTLLVALAAFIWLRDLRWQDGIGDSLPILLALPLFVWLRAPWKLRDEPWRLAPVPAFAACALFPLGIVVDSGLVLAVAWTALLWSWMRGRVEERAEVGSGKLLLLPVLSFPWMLTDLERVAWWFRLSGAGAAAAVMDFSGFTVLREGTLLWVNDFAVSVEPACSGVNGLQSILVAGAALAWFHLRQTPLFWWNVPLLVAAAWLANLLRILSATWAGALMEPATAAKWVDPLHSFAGWLALCAVFVGCHAVFAVQARAVETGWRRAAALPWLEIILIGYAAWCARGLVQTWVWTPYDRFGWLAFALWIAPLLWRPREPSPHAMPPGLRTALLAGGLFAVVLGNVADVNFCYHVALAAFLGGLSRRAGYFVWLCGAVAWMPVAGWFASRLGLDPAGFVVARVLAAAGAAAWGFGWVYRPRDKFVSLAGAVAAAAPGRTRLAR